MNSYFICATQTSNMGDLIINKMLIDELCCYGKVYVDAYGIPEDFKSVLLRNPNTIDVPQKYRCTAKRFSLLNIIKLFRLIRKQNIVQLTQSPGPLSKYPFRLRWGFEFLYLFFKINGVIIRFYGNCCSAVAINNIPLDHMCVDKYFLRSYVSIKYAQKYYGGKCFYIPDLAFLLYYHVNENKRCCEKSNIVAFNVRMGQNERLLITKCVEYIAYLVAQGYKVVLFHQVSSDYRVSELLYKYCSMPNVLLHKERIWYDDIDFYANKKFVVSNRLHSLLTGAAYGAIPIGLIEKNALQSKIDDVFHSANFPEKNLISLDESVDRLNLYDLYFNVGRIFQRNAELCRRTIKQSMEEFRH